MMRSPLFLAFALAVGAGTPLLAGEASAQTARAVRATAEMSMVLSGHIEITPEGEVSSLVLDQKSALTPSIASFVEGTIGGWRFEPTLRDGKAVAARAPMRVRLRGTQMADGGYQVSMTSVDFSEYDPKATDSVTRKQMAPPRYPEDAYRNGAQGEVLLMVKVARDGTVADVIAEQVNMAVVGPERAMAKMRDILAKASISSARSWTFNPPTTGESSTHDSWTVRIPVSFALGNDRNAGQERYGRWRAFIPGPRQAAPWRERRSIEQAGSDLLPEGGVYMVDGAKRGVRLLTPLEQG
ncbi:energy transducer TonB [Stenotrophomonas maltophilia]|uniref:Energy transducer TonB n=1 Tax=Stenotrophomonas maltophilia TaxID=40324 RepID=A0AAI9BZK4_STEMA|nr:energy transducer TonB [Stenotrophomonas maltophilia]AWT16467.1 TonB-dependent receptor [Stenotrophomonas maltophilia]EKT4091396.1 energy transducer TonB [Stenotrophomonas maltophilia]HEL4101638.1 energy transducer TonB [Stenotrophomonas maltophilia]HEL5046087.1 energy transducer TonB [Stenotrophomonas maltophilia]